MITKLIHIGLSGAFLMLPPAASLRADDPGSLATLLPYGAAPTALEPPPPGYKPVFVESLNRHGSRALTNPRSIDRSLALWNQARGAGALTTLGKKFGPDVRRLRQDNIALGYGELSSLGAGELRGIGRRTAERLPGLLDGDANVELRTSGIARATESADNFAKGLTDESTGLDVGGRPVVDHENLQFDHDDPDFRRFLATDAATDDAIAAIEDSRAVVDTAKSLLDRLYGRAFVARIDDSVAEARAVYGLYAIGPAMRAESHVDLSPYLKAKQAEVLAYVADAHYFYQRGPGIAGRDGSFKAAGVLRDDFFEEIDRRLAGGKADGVFRFGHAEQIIPFAALLKLPGSDQQAELRTPLTRANNPWRGAEVSRLAANIQWIVYDDKKTPLVAMLYNERQIPFQDGCLPYAEDSYLYELAELRRCLY